jgi:hypothetical protein
MSTELVANLCNIMTAFQTKLVPSLLHFEKLIHGGPDLGKSIVTTRMCFRYKNLTCLLKN